jgi:hypothetical protein
VNKAAIAKVAESRASDQAGMAIARHVSPQMLEPFSHIRRAAKRAAPEAISTTLPDARAGSKFTKIDGDAKPNHNQTKIG